MTSFIIFPFALAAFVLFALALEVLDALFPWAAEEEDSAPGWAG